MQTKKDKENILSFNDAPVTRRPTQKLGIIKTSHKKKRKNFDFTMEDIEQLDYLTEQLSIKNNVDLSANKTVRLLIRTAYKKFSGFLKLM